MCISTYSCQAGPVKPDQDLQIKHSMPVGLYFWGVAILNREHVEYVMAACADRPSWPSFQESASFIALT